MNVDYVSSKDQTRSAASVEEMQEQSKVDQAVRQERKEAYVDFLTSLDDLQRDEFEIGHQFEDHDFSNQTEGDRDALQARMQQAETVHQQTFRAATVIGLIGSYGPVQDATANVIDTHNDVLHMIDKFANGVLTGTLDAALKDKPSFDAKLRTAACQADKFRDAARIDLDGTSITSTNQPSTPLSGSTPQTGPPANCQN